MKRLDLTANGRTLTVIVEPETFGGSTKFAYLVIDEDGEIITDSRDCAQDVWLGPDEAFRHGASDATSLLFSLIDSGVI